MVGSLKCFLKSCICFRKKNEEEIHMEMTSTSYAILGSVLVSAVASLMGSFLVLQRRSLLVDMLGHSVFPGVLLGFIMAGWQRSTGYFFLGALLAIAISYFLFVRLGRDSRVGYDAATAISLSGMFAIGATLLSWIQLDSSGAQAGLNTFLMGQAALISKSDAMVFLSLFILISVFFFKFRFSLKVWAFDEDFAHVAGFKSRWLALTMYGLVGVSVFFAVQAVGVVLASALFVLAPVAALLWVRRFETLLWLSVLFSVLGAFVGAWWSSVDERMPTGAAIIGVLFVLFLFAWLFSPSGYLKAYRQRRSTVRSRLAEDLLKTWYYFFELEGFPKNFFVTWEKARSRLGYGDSKPDLSVMQKLLKPWTTQMNDVGFLLSEKGMRQSTLLVRRHRLWESYLVNKMGFRADHVHDDAERVEHFIGDDLEFRIEAELGTDMDPHGKPIPTLPKKNRGDV